jgi:tRNA(Ile)-lysidine synthase
VAVGHTADDQVETVLMHFLRGAGLAGLKGMEYRIILPVFDPQTPLVRPLLSLWRTEIELYCRQHDLRPHFDTSNTDQVYFRNRLRHTLVPELEKYNPRFKESLLQTAQALQGDYASLQPVLDGVWKEVVIETGSGCVVFDQAALGNLSTGLQRNLIRRAAEFLRPDDRDFGFDAFERAVAFARVPPGKQIDFVNGLFLFSENDRITLAAYDADLPFTQWPQIEQPSSLSHPLPAAGGQPLELGNGWVLITEEMRLNDENWRPDTDPWSAWLDADRLQAGNLVIRSRRAGDVFTPLGMSGQTTKVRDFYINVKIPRRARLHWPLVCAGDQVAWVAGYRIAHPFRITPKTKNVLHLEIKKLSET